MVDTEEHPRVNRGAVAEGRGVGRTRASPLNDGLDRRRQFQPRDFPAPNRPGRQVPAEGYRFTRKGSWGRICESFRSAYHLTDDDRRGYGERVGVNSLKVGWSAELDGWAAGRASPIAAAKSLVCQSRKDGPWHEKGEAPTRAQVEFHGPGEEVRGQILLGCHPTSSPLATCSGALPEHPLHGFGHESVG